MVEWGLVGGDTQLGVSGISSGGVEAKSPSMFELAVRDSLSDLVAGGAEDSVWVARYHMRHTAERVAEGVYTVGETERRKREALLLCELA